MQSKIAVRHGEDNGRDGNKEVVATKIAELMSRTLVCVSPETGVQDAETLAQARGVRHLLITQEDDLLGITCVCDLRNAPPGTRISTLMSTPITIAAAASLSDAAHIMRTREVGCLPVVAGGLLLGIVTRGDLHRAGVSGDETLLAGVCASCGDFHEVHALTGDVAFCGACLAHIRDLDDEYEPTGDGD